MDETKFIFIVYKAYGGQQGTQSRQGRAHTVPRAGTLIGTLKAKVPSRDMGLTTDIHPCAQIVSEWLSAMSYNAYMLAKRASAGEVAYFGACHF